MDDDVNFFLLANRECGFGGYAGQDRSLVPWPSRNQMALETQTAVACPSPHPPYQAGSSGGLFGIMPRAFWLKRLLIYALLDVDIITPRITLRPSLGDTA